MHPLLLNGCPEASEPEPWNCQSETQHPNVWRHAIESERLRQVRVLLRYGADPNHAVPATDSGTVIQCSRCGRTQVRMPVLCLVPRARALPASSALPASLSLI